MLKVNAKKHLDELVKDRDSWKVNCCRIWKGVSPVLDLISPELPESQPRAPQLTPVEKAQRVWDWLQQFVKDAGEFAGAHVLSMVRAHYPLRPQQAGEGVPEGSRSTGSGRASG